MNRLIRVTLASFAITAILCGAALIVGRAQPADPPLPELTRCGELMCVYGIQVDKTILSDALAILKQTGEFSISSTGDQYLYKQTPRYYRLNLFGTPAAQHQVFSTSSPVNELNIYFYDPIHSQALTVADLVMSYGSPCAVSRRSGLIALNYPGMSVVTNQSYQTPSQQLEPGLQITAITVFNNKLTSCASIRESGNFIEWRGFTNYPFVPS